MFAQMKMQQEKLCGFIVDKEGGGVKDTKNFNGHHLWVIPYGFYDGP